MCLKSYGLGHKYNAVTTLMRVCGIDTTVTKKQDTEIIQFFSHLFLPLTKFDLCGTF